MRPRTSPQPCCGATDHFATADLRRRDPLLHQGQDFRRRGIGRARVDQRTAEAIQLRLEYNPAPPFNSGSPDTAPPEILALMKDKIAPAQARRTEMIGRAAARMT